MASTLALLIRSGKLIQNSCSTNAKRLHRFQGLCWRPTATCTPSSATFSTAVETTNEQKNVEQSHKMNKAMKAYLERAQAHDTFMSEQIAEYEIGRRHLANIMGEDPETFTDEDKARAIAYLFPSGLFEPRARPHMKHPSEVFPKRKAAEFDESGRPFHTLFYTGRPSYYQVLHDIAGKIRELDRFSSRMTKFNVVAQEQEKTLSIGGTQWLNKEEFESKIIEVVKDDHYEFFIKSMDRLVNHPLSYRVKDFIMNFRKEVKVAHGTQEIPKLAFTTEGVPYMTASGARKTATANVTVYGRGSGNITVNGQDILYFSNIQEREQIVFPLHFTEMLGTVDVVADVEGGGVTGQSGAVRYALAMALRSFVDSEMVEKMRLAGLLTFDLRRRERKKPGQKGARAKYTWKKR